MSVVRDVCRKGVQPCQKGDSGVGGAALDEPSATGVRGWSRENFVQTSVHRKRGCCLSGIGATKS